MRARIAVMAPWIVGVSLAMPLSAQTLSGTVFRDFNANGVRDALEPGAAGLSVAVFDDTGAMVGTAVTLMNGTYSAPLSVGAGTPVRLELAGLPAFLAPGPSGTDSGTTVIFSLSGSTGVDVGVLNPGEFCQADPDLATSCYVVGDQAGQPDDVLLSFPFSAGAGGTSPPPGVDLPAATHLAAAQEIGPTFGLAYQAESGSLFAASLMKRHAGFGPGGTGMIYRIDVPGGGGSPFLDLNALFGPGTAGADPHPAGTNFSVDPNAWDPVGKVGLGDLDISDDGLTLWTVNLADRQLYEIPIGVPPTAPAAGAIGRFPVPQPGDCPDPATNVRPFGLAVRDALVYLGLVCSAESTQDPADLRAYVYSFNGATFTEVLNFPLNYPRGCGVVDGMGMCDPFATWNPWVTTFTVIASFSAPGEVVYPQPWLTDIEFSGDVMILGLRDRFGDQAGFNENSTDPMDPTLFIGDAAGDILCASPTVGGWTIESNGSCGARVSAGGVGNSEGPGGGEFFFRENHPRHDETSLGGLVQVPGFAQVATSIYDPIFDVAEIFQAGILWFDHQDGSRVRAYRVYETTAVGTTFAKGGGLGDLEALCDPAPLEIGNRVWEDLDDDGVQDPGEPGIPGVGVDLVCGTPLASTSTDAAGEYYFNNANVLGGLPARTSCELRIDLADAALGGRFLAAPDSGPNDLNDSDFAVSGGQAVVSFLTGGPGGNDHTFDAGFGSGRDFGDAPEASGYATLLVSDGARHTVLTVNNPTLGLAVDVEADGQPSFSHTGDDLDGTDDEDGVMVPAFLVLGMSADIEVSTGAVGGNLNAWIDFNRDGDWLDAGEQIATDMALAANTTTVLSVPVPAAAILGPSCSRFRLSSQTGLAPTGAAADGEVEDHVVFLSADGEPDEIPTLGGWGFLLFVLGLAAFGLKALRRGR